ncbi:Kinesin-like protein KIN-7E [Turnera subulata]|uniref:Kinesin-like protein KIN-7E n=1 Tax=Turnera subulata TaxID=218843 RepID=A0A9Q0JE82_9ROSI|nr:Kinesin-like protein KIN-7E [Turnera subulata]
MSSTSRSHRSSSAISPFRSRKSPSQPPPPPQLKPSPRPPTPSSSSSSRPPSRLSNSPVSPPLESTKSKENVTVTVRFRPLSGREINKGDEVAWYADGDYTVRNEYNNSIAYGFDKVFGPATTTRHVYDVAAQHVISGAMQGINGTVFAYGVTSSGKTHTMHGEQKSPGIIPLAVKDVFGIIQETPGREFLLRVSYLEIYNEVINDLLDPAGQNLRIREDAQGTYVEGIKEEVVLSPAHALSLIASGEEVCCCADVYPDPSSLVAAEHRHVGSNNFNLLSSRSHTIFTLTIESSPRGENHGEEDVTLSQLHLIDLAGSESSKTETTGLRRKEGSFINKSLLTLGTVISKLTDGKAIHIPYRDSKLTRLLQSSLSGHGRISLICTVTPASSNSEETHNTLKFAQRSKHVEIKASQNKIVDEKSLIKKYQKEISCLKQELQQLKEGMMENPYTAPSAREDLVNLKLQLEAGQVKLQSRLEEEEQAKAALMGRIQRLTKLILVSTKNSMQSTLPERPGHRRRHSFGEDELAYLPDRKRDYMSEEDAVTYTSELSTEGKDDVTSLDELVKEYKRNKRRGVLGWFKLKKPGTLVGSSPNADSESSASGSPASCSKSSQNKVVFTDVEDDQRKSITKKDDCMLIHSFPERTQAGDLFSATIGGRPLPPVGILTSNTFELSQLQISLFSGDEIGAIHARSGTTITDQMDLLREQVKVLAGDVALCTSSLKRLSEKAASNSEDSELEEQMQKLKNEINEKKLQMHLLEQRIIGSAQMTPQLSNSIEMSKALSKLATQLNEKTFELEIKSADNRILQEQLQMKISENNEMQEIILLLRQQLNAISDKTSINAQKIAESKSITRNTGNDVTSKENRARIHENCPCEETYTDVNTPKSVMSLNRILSQEDSKECYDTTFLNSQVLMQATEIESLKQDKVKLIEEKEGLEIHSQKLAEEASYAKDLAAAAAVELRNLAEEVTKLSYENAKLTGDLAAAKEVQGRSLSSQRSVSYDSSKQNNSNSAYAEGRARKTGDGLLVEELQKELNARYRRETALEATLLERDKIEGELRERLDEAKRHEEDLENELANMWLLVAKFRKSGLTFEMQCEDLQLPNASQAGLRTRVPQSAGHSGGRSKDYETRDAMGPLEQVRASYQEERRKCKELETVISRLRVLNHLKQNVH